MFHSCNYSHVELCFYFAFLGTSELRLEPRLQPVEKRFVEWLQLVDFVELD